MSRTRIALVVASAAAVLAAAFFFFRPSRLAEVDVVPVRRGEVRSSVNATTTGTVSSDGQAILAARVSGPVVRLTHKGDRIEAGEPVAVVDEGPYRAAARQAEGALDSARAELERLESGRRMRVEGMDSERDRARAVVARARADYERLRDLHRQGIVSERELQVAEADLRVAEAAQRSAEAGSDEPRVIERELLAARGRVAQAEGALETARLQLAWCRVEAPFGGVVGETLVRVGELVAPGQLVASLYDPSSLYVESAVDEVDLPRIAVGQSARLLFDSFPGETFPGAVRRIAPVVSTRKREGRTADIEVSLEDPSGRVRPGMSVDCEIVIEEVPDVPFVPTNAVIAHGGRDAAWVVRGGRARRVEIETGAANWERTEVRAGLAEGDLVVVSNPRTLEEGERVRTVEASRGDAFPGPTAAP